MTLQKQLSTKDLIFLVVGLIALAVVLATALLPYGQVKLSYDSYDILGGSESLDAYLNGKSKDGHSYLVRAPLHPFLLYFFNNKMLAMWWINVLSLAGSLISIYKICRRSDFSITVSFGVVVITGVFIPWLLNFQFLWTEPVFIFLTLTLCYALQTSRSFSHVVILCVLLFLTRKSGLFFFGAVAVFYLTERKLLYAIVISLLAVFLFAGLEWIEFSYQSTGFFPQWLPKLESYSRIYYLDAMTSWVLPLRIPLLFRSVFILAILSTAFYFFRGEIVVAFRERQNVILILLAGIYSVILISFRGVSEYEDAERYLTVLFPLWLILTTSVVLKILQTGSRRAAFFVSLAIGIWLLYIFSRTVHYLFWSVV